MSESNTSIIRKITAQIVSSYLGSNPTETGHVPKLIQEVARTIARLGVPESPAEAEPSVPIKGSVRAESITCLACGEQMTMLRRHLSSAHATTPEEYRKKWGLEPEYPMIAPAYSKLRRKVAIDSGLGRKDNARRRGRAWV